MSKGRKMGQHQGGGGQGHVRQDGSGNSNVLPADVATWKGMPDGHDKFVFAVKHRPGIDGRPVTIAEDMRQHPQVYGFADSAAAAVWINDNELAK